MAVIFVFSLARGGETEHYKIKQPIRQKSFVPPMQKFNRDLAEIGEIGEISPRLTRSRRDLGEICIVADPWY